MSYTNDNCLPVWMKPNPGEYPALTTAAVTNPFKHELAAESARFKSSLASQ